MTKGEEQFLGLIERYTETLPEYDRAVTDTFALAAFRAGYRTAKADAARGVEREQSVAAR